MDHASALRSNSGRNKIITSAGVPHTHFCATCHSIFTGNPDRFENRNDTRGGWDQNRFAHHDTFKAFRESANEGCYICLRVYAHLRDRIGRNMVLEDESIWETPFTIYTMRLGWDMERNESEAELHIEAKMPDRSRGTDFVEFLLFSSNDYKISQQLPPVLGSIQSLAMVRSWLESCIGPAGTCNEGGDDTIIPEECFGDSFNLRARSGEANNSDSGTSFVSTESLEDHHHKPCAYHSNPGYMPTRILELGDESSQNWRVCVPAEDGVEQKIYTTVSYRWGDEPFVKLTKQLLPHFRVPKPISELPQLFQDAMTITRHLGYQYLWIDALCIIQDSNEEFKDEIENMAEIYSNSALNIIAATCKSPFETLFKPRNFGGCHVGRFWPSWVTTNPFFSSIRGIDSIMETDCIEREIKTAATSQRGWILQEMVLPPRRLYFLSSQLYFFCRRTEICEVFSQEMPSRLTSFCQTYDLPTPYGGDSPCYRWQSLVEEYSQCSLTNPKDKMFALLGLVKVFKAEMGDDYLAGLWKSRLSWTLAWTCDSDSPRHRSALNIAPTWSWASVDGKITYHETGYPDRHHSVLCEVLDVSITPDDSELAENAPQGILIIRAPSFVVYATSDGGLDIPFIPKDKRIYLKFVNDDITDRVIAGARRILAVLTVEGTCDKFLSEGQHHMEGKVDWRIRGLVLQQDETNDFCRRVGTLEAGSKSSDDYAETQLFLQIFGLKIKDSFGTVEVSNITKRKVLRII